jgi:hypothetical protein
MNNMNNFNVSQQPMNIQKGGGTSILSLKNNNNQNNNQNINNINIPNKLSDNDIYNIMTNNNNNNNNNNNINNNNNAKNNENINKKNENIKKNMGNLVTDISKELDEFRPSNKTENYSDESIMTEIEDINTKKNNGKNIYRNLYDTLIIFIIYIVMSQNFIKKTIFEFVPKSNENYKTQINILVYGIIISILFFVIKSII